MDESPMFDLVYCGDSREDMLRDQRILLDRFKTGIAKDVWDEIHGYRIEVETGEPISEVDFFFFMANNGISSLGLGFLERDRTKLDVLKQIVSKLDAEKLKEE